MEFWVIFLIMVTSVLMIASTSISIQCIKDNSKTNQKFSIGMLVMSILVLLLSFYLTYAHFKPAPAVTGTI
jgi:cell division protein FtsW (lipid II flippase)